MPVHGYPASFKVSLHFPASHRMWERIELLMLYLCGDLVRNELDRCTAADGCTQPVEPVVYAKMADRLEEWLKRQRWLDEDEEQCMEAWRSFLRYCGGFAVSTPRWP